MATTSEAPVSAETATHTTIRSSLGDLTVVARGGAVTGLYFPHHWHRPDPAGFGEYQDAGFDDVRRQLDEYLAGERREFDLPADDRRQPVPGTGLAADQADPLRGDRKLRRAGAGAGRRRPRPRRSAPRWAATR